MNLKMVVCVLCVVAALVIVAPRFVGAANPTVIQHVHNSTLNCETGGNQKDTCFVTITWPVAFVDTNYTVVCGTQNILKKTAASWAWVPISGRTVTSAQLWIETLNSLSTTINGVDCIGMHN